MSWKASQDPTARMQTPTFAIIDMENNDTYLNLTEEEAKDQIKELMDEQGVTDADDLSNVSVYKVVNNRLTEVGFESRTKDVEILFG